MYIRVKATPGAKKDAVRGMGVDLYAVATKEPAEDNRANKRIRELLAAEIGASPGALLLVSGHHTPNKRYLLRRGKEYT